MTPRKLAATGSAVAIAAAAAIIPAMAVAHAQPRHARATVAAATVVTAAKTSIGTILVAPNGHTLYAFSKDARNKDVCATIGGCLEVWPMFTTRGSVTAGAGVKKSLLGTITVKGKKQITYAGHPLYFYSGDDGPKSTYYVGILQSGGHWPAVSPTGSFVK